MPDAPAGGKKHRRARKADHDCPVRRGLKQKKQCGRSADSPKRRYAAPQGRYPFDIRRIYTRKERDRGKFKGLLGLEGHRPQFQPSRRCFYLDPDSGDESKRRKPYCKRKKVWRIRAQAAIINARKRSKQYSAKQESEQKLRHRNRGEARAVSCKQAKRRGREYKEAEQD